MKRFSKSILYAAATFLFAACSSPDRSKELATVDSLQTIAANYSDSMQMALFDSVAIITEETKAKSDFLMETYRDSTDREFWVDNFSDYARLHKKSDEYEKELAELRKDWELSITQLDDLKMDISNNAIDFEKAALYIGKEADAIEVQKHEFETLKGRVKNYISVYHRTRDVIEDRLARLKGEQEEESL